MSVYYNEHDPFAAAWLRELIVDGLIAPGEVDERSIEDVLPGDLSGFVQCHFFAGIGVWSLALRQAGWPDDEPIWTGSCPCPPFSSAGKEFRCPLCDTRSPVPNAVRTGAFDCIRCGHEWQADSRHLFPEFWRLIRDAQPELVLGEQVASKDGRTWIDVVRASLEMLGYAVGHPDVPACGFGTPHIRNRLYWVADAGCAGSSKFGGRSEQPSRLAPDRSARRVADTNAERSEGWPFGDAHYQVGRVHAEQGNGRHAGVRCGAVSRPADPAGPDQFGHGGVSRTSAGAREGEARSQDGNAYRGSGGLVPERPGPLNGLWRDADWLCCTDGKWRPVAPGTFPLAPAGTVRNRVGTLRGAGNAINLAQAAGFIEAVMDVRAGSLELAA